MFDLTRPNSSEGRRPSPSPKPTSQTDLAIVTYAEIDGMGMGRLSNGEAYLSQRGLAHLCGVQNAHIGAISRDWHEDKPRIAAIKARLARFGFHRDLPHRVLSYDGRRQYCYDMAVVQAVLDYYALDAGGKCQPEAQANRARFTGDALQTYIFKALGANIPPVEPIRFVATPATGEDLREEMLNAFLTYICGLCAMSLWLANTYLEGLKARALNAPWNRLGLYLPLKAILEIQAEAVLMTSKNWASKNWSGLSRTEP